MTLAEMRQNLLVWGFKKIIEETRTTQLFYGQFGGIRKRRKPRAKLRALGDGSPRTVRNNKKKSGKK